MALNLESEKCISIYCILLQDDVEQKEGQQIVADAVHDFLQVLCASHKYGIIFHDRSIGTSGKKHNELLQTVLEVNILFILKSLVPIIRDKKEITFFAFMSRSFLGFPRPLSVSRTDHSCPNNAWRFTLMLLRTLSWRVVTWTSFAPHKKMI